MTNVTSMNFNFDLDRILSSRITVRMTAFISGHLTLTGEEFDTYYRPTIDDMIKAGHAVVVGDARGADLMAQTYLSQCGHREVTVYHMFNQPRVNVGNWPTVGGYTSDRSRDAAMTAASTYDIAWVRDPAKRSGTRDNLERRAKKHK